MHWLTYMPHFDWTLSFGSLLTIVSFAIACIVTYTKATRWLATQFTRFELTLAMHAEQLGHHAERMDRYEGRYIEIAGQLQRIIGRIEEQDRSPFPRNRRIVNGK